MKIIANGEEKVVVDKLPVDAFLASCGWKSTQVVVEYNGKVLTRSDVKTQTLAEGDRLEIIVPVAGG